jgi:hypothetical protein
MGNSLPYVKVFFQHILEGLKETKKTLNHVIWPSGCESGPGKTEYEAQIINT